MTCQELAGRIQQIEPHAAPREVARLCLLLTNFADDLAGLGREEQLAAAWKQAGLRLQAATDQHAAMTQELEALANSDPEKFTPEQIWVLVRAIKVQSQILSLYVGQLPLDV
jgi:hypothetical protein